MPRTSTTLSTDILSLGIRITIQTFKKVGNLKISSILLLKSFLLMMRVPPCIVPSQYPRVTVLNKSWQSYSVTEAMCSFSSPPHNQVHSTYTFSA